MLKIRNQEIKEFIKMFEEPVQCGHSVHKPLQLELLLITGPHN